MISEDVRARIRRLFFAEHWKIGTIAAELGLHRDTVACAVDTSRFSNCRFRGQALILDPYRDFVRATLEQYPRLRVTRLHEMLRARGYQGSVFPLRRYVRLIRPVPIREAFFRLSTLPGEEAQVDWGSFGKIRVGGAERALSCFVMVLSWSRATFARFTLDQTLESFLRCHVEAFEMFQGVPRSALYEYVPRNIFVLLFPSGICARGIVYRRRALDGEEAPGTYGDRTRDRQRSRRKLQLRLSCLSGTSCDRRRSIEFERRGSHLRLKSTLSGSRRMGIRPPASKPACLCCSASVSSRVAEARARSRLFVATLTPS
jgi:hypothetical protein